MQEEWMFWTLWFSYDKIIPKVVTMDELKEAIKAINTGKSEDIYGLSIENIIYAGEEFLHHLQNLGRQRAVPNYESVRASL
jgi:hypothetical protein